MSFPLVDHGRHGPAADVVQASANQGKALGGEVLHRRREVQFSVKPCGGWINGRGDDTMVMLKGYAHLVDFFTSFEWWKTEPHDELVNNGAYCLAKPGEIYAVYLPIRPLCGNTAVFEYKNACGDVTLKLEPGKYDAHWFSAFTGEIIPLPAVQGPVWTLPKPPGWMDWAVLLTRRR